MSKNPVSSSRLKRLGPETVLYRYAVYRPPLFRPSGLASNNSAGRRSSHGRLVGSFLETQPPQNDRQPPAHGYDGFLRHICAGDDSAIEVGRPWTVTLHRPCSPDQNALQVLLTARSKYGLAKPLSALPHLPALSRDGLSLSNKRPESLFRLRPYSSLEKMKPAAYARIV